jgi:hypothetical protein
LIRRRWSTLRRAAPAMSASQLNVSDCFKL